MRFFHLADLHLGKRLGNISLIPDQEYILEQILALIKEYRPQALLLAGDIYDRSTPSTDAVKIFDDFLTADCSAKTHNYRTKQHNPVGRLETCRNGLSL